MTLKYADIFAGLGGFSLAIKRAFPLSQCVFASEIDKNAKNTFKTNFNIEPSGDITLINKKTIPDHDILFGGFPCQPFSRNGKFFNKNDKTVANDVRANLFLQLVEILNIKSPNYFIFENVKGLKTMKNLDGSLYFDVIIDELSRAGYNVHTKVLNSADYGSPQQRERLFFVGVKKNIKHHFEFPEKQLNFRTISEILEPNPDSKLSLTHLWKNRKVLKNPLAILPANHNFPVGSSRLLALHSIYQNNTLEPTKKIIPTAILYGDTPSGGPRQQDKVYSPLGLSPTITTFSTPAISPSKDYTTWRMLSPRECARLQGIPDWFILPNNKAVAYKQVGNAINVDVVSLIIQKLLT